ncbi:uncharacterized protein LOC116845251 [Odontomachus brunneus]|uniref:uncharacterized protein LOC116845251 n=1 Tax=Odontomachus brunneus TaxID=486640 RepID=UPI0013F1E447|nr:uncharacterized protein LOC116845251 [Odontomachus brunneus]
MEHKDYATVSYDQSAVTCTLSMPGDLRVSISGRGHYEVSMGSEVNLKVTSGKRTDHDRTELPRSTYSFPHNWLFPFGKGGRRVLSTKRTRNEVSARQNEQPLPKLLRVRVFFGIKEADRSVLIDIQRAMGRYWISVFRDGDKCRLFYASSRLDQVENDHESSENGLPRELALGLRGSIDAQTYVGGLRSKLIKLSAGARRQPSRLAELLRQRGFENEEYEWYKQCMRKRIIAPYFRNIADSCHLLLKDLVDEAARVSRNLPHAAESKLINL